MNDNIAGCELDKDYSEEEMMTGMKNLAAVMYFTEDRLIKNGNNAILEELHRGEIHRALLKGMKLAMVEFQPPSRLFGKRFCITYHKLINGSTEELSNLLLEFMDRNMKGLN